MKVTVLSQVTIAKKPTDIFRYIADPRLHYLWNPHLRTVSAKRKLKQGVSYTTTSLMLGVKIENDNRITKFEVNSLMEIQGHGGTLEYCVEYRLLPDGKLTVVECNTTVTATGRAFAFAKPVLSLLAQRELQSDLQALKLAVEHQLK
jgi:uncharacterized protein YndB with AHSA1/START domain